MTPDTTDPIVVFIAWALTWVVGKLVSGPKLKQLRHALPAIAVLIAVAARAAIEAGQGHTLTVELALRSLGAGAVAVMGHAQIREVQKALSDIRATPVAPVDAKETKT